MLPSEALAIKHTRDGIFLWRWNYRILQAEEAEKEELEEMQRNANTR